LAHPLTTNSVSIPVGQAQSVPIELYSDGPTGTWTVGVEDYECWFTGQTSQALLGITLTAGTNSTCMSSSADPCMPQLCTGQNGSTVNANIDVKTAGNPSTNGRSTNTELFVITSQQGTGSNSLGHFQFGLVSN
jgi:hypothetical protein